MKTNKTIMTLASVVMLTCMSSFALVACASTPHQESAGQYLDSSAITAEVKARLLGDKEIKSSNISVESYKGTVQLSGFVDSERQKSKAGDIARQVRGVKRVENNLLIKNKQ